MNAPFSKYIAYVDEAGDHGPTSAEFPVFALAFCIVEKTVYANELVPALHRLKFKFKYFGHVPLCFTSEIFESP